ncbi:MAG: ComEA family DNA-binding protein [Clostridiales bacterium]|nr:ComEA family DNA-binding protein [Clostridiales bacterium]
MNIMFKYSRAAAGLLLCMALLGGCGDSASVLQSDTGNEETEASVVSTEEPSEQDSHDGKVSSEEPKDENAMIYVDVQGAVNAPGVYQLPEGSRIFHALELAGGISGDGAADLVNQAGILEDGQQIRIYTKEEAEEIKKEQPLISENGSPSGEQSAGKVNINRADKTELMTLTGIGETRAEAILAYREANGGFSCVEDLMQVEGIKGKTYEKLEDQITVD